MREKNKGGVPGSAEKNRISRTEAPHDSTEFMRRQNLFCRQPATGRKGESGVLDNLQIGTQKRPATNINHIIQACYQ